MPSMSVRLPAKMTAEQQDVKAFVRVALMSEGTAIVQRYDEWQKDNLAPWGVLCCANVMFREKYPFLISRTPYSEEIYRVDEKFLPMDVIHYRRLVGK